MRSGPACCWGRATARCPCPAAAATPPAPRTDACVGQLETCGGPARSALSIISTPAERDAPRPWPSLARCLPSTVAPHAPRVPCALPCDRVKSAARKLEQGGGRWPKTLTHAFVRMFPLASTSHKTGVRTRPALQVEPGFRRHGYLPAGAVSEPVSAPDISRLHDMYRGCAPAARPRPAAGPARGRAPGSRRRARRGPRRASARPGTAGRRGPPRPPRRRPPHRRREGRPPCAPGRGAARCADGAAGAGPGVAGAKLVHRNLSLLCLSARRVTGARPAWDLGAAKALKVRHRPVVC